MALREILLPWDSQPQEAVGLKATHPLASHCVGLWIASVPSALAARGRVDILSRSGTTQVVSPAGLGTKFGVSSVSTGIISLPNTAEQRLSGVNGSILIGATAPTIGSSEYPHMWSVRDASTQVAVLTLGSDETTYTGGRVGFSAGGSDIIGGSGSAKQNEYAVYGVQWGANGRRLYVNGALEGTSASTTQIATSTIQPSLGNRQSGGRAFTGMLHWWMAFDVNIGDEWHASLSADPWQLVDDQRIGGPVSTGAGGDASITLPSASATSAAGTLSATGAASATLSGVQAVSQAGVVSAAGGAAAALVGAEAAAQVGSVAGTGGAVFALVSAAATTDVGSITAVGGGSAAVTLTGVQAVAAAGSVTASGGAAVELQGVQAAGQVGAIDVLAGGSVAVTLPGTAASAAVGSITATGGAQIVLASAHAVAAAGAVWATGGAAGAISAPPSGRRLSEGERPERISAGTRQTRHSTGARAGRLSGGTRS